MNAELMAQLGNASDHAALLAELQQQPLLYDDAALLQLMLLAEQQQWAQAKLLSWRLIDMQPTDITVRLWLACIHWQLGEFVQMQTVLSPFRLWPVAESIQQQLVSTLLALLDNDQAQAQQWLQRAKQAPDAQYWQTLIAQLEQWFSQLDQQSPDKPAVADDGNTAELAPSVNTVFLQGLYQKKY